MLHPKPHGSQTITFNFCAQVTRSIMDLQAVARHLWCPYTQPLQSGEVSAQILAPRMQTFWEVSAHQI